MPKVVFPCLGSPSRSKSESSLLKRSKTPAKEFRGPPTVDSRAPRQDPKYVTALREFEKCRVTSGYSVESIYTALNPRGTETLPLVEFAQNMSCVLPVCSVCSCVLCACLSVCLCACVSAYLRVLLLLVLSTH